MSHNFISRTAVIVDFDLTRIICRAPLVVVLPWFAYYDHSKLRIIYRQQRCPYTSTNLEIIISMQCLDEMKNKSAKHNVNNKASSFIITSREI